MSNRNVVKCPWQGIYAFHYNFHFKEYLMAWINNNSIKDESKSYKQ